MPEDSLESLIIKETPENSESLEDLIIKEPLEEAVEDTEPISIDNKLNLKPDEEGLYNIRINDKIERFATPFMAGEPSIIRTQVQEVGRNANKDEVKNIVNVMDSLQKDVYSNLSKYGIVEEGTLGAETYNLTVEDNRKIKDTIYEDFKSKTGLDIDRGSFDYVYNALEKSNKDKVEQEYKLSRIRPESTTLNKDFENQFAIQADKGKSETQLKVEELKEKQGNITFEITSIDNKINQVKNNQEITSKQKETQLDNFEDGKKKLLQESKNLDSEINVLATTTERGPGRFGEDFGVSYQKTNKELTADFFNEQGRSEETVNRLSKLAEDTDNTAGVKAQNVLNTNPGISQREAVKKLYEDELLYLQQFEADGRNKFVNLKFSQAQLTGGNPIGSGVLKKLRDNNISIDEQGNVEVSLNQLRNLGVDSRDFEGFFDSLPGMVNDKDLKAIKSYNEEIDEVSTIAKSYRNLWRNNVDVGAIEKPSSLGFFTESAAKATLGYVGFNEKEAYNFITGGKGTARTRINDLDTAIKVANQTEEVRKSMGGKIDLTDKQKENIDVSLSEEVATGVGAFVPDLMILGATGGTMNALGYTKLISKMSPMARFVTGAFVEEAKMQLILDMKPGGGAAFYTLGQATAGLTPFKKKFKWLDPIFQKVIKAGPVGAISAEGAQISELAYESLIGDKNFNTEFEELYKDFDTVKRRAIVNSMVFGATGFTHVKRGDLMTTRRKYEVVGELQAKVNELMGLPKETATSIESSAGVTIPEALKPKKNFEDLTPKEQKKFMEYSKRIQTLDQMIQVETMYHKLDPNSKNFEKDFDKMVTQPMNKGIKAVIPEFEGVKVKFGKGKEFRKQSFETNDKGEDLGNTAEYNPKTKEMFFDLDLYTAGKPVHEFTHAAVNAYFDANPNAKRNFTKRMSSIFSDFDFGQYTGTELETRIKNAYGLDLRKVQDRNLTAEEYLAFMGEFLADPKLYYTDTNLASNLMNEFRLEIKDILIESGIEKFAPTPKTAKDMVQLMALLGKSTRMGSKLDVKIGTLAKLDEIDILGTRLIEGNRESVTKETRASKEIIDENENIVNRLKEAKEKGDTQAETDAKNDLLINNQGLINEFVNTKFVPDLGITREDFRSGVQLHVLDKVNKTYDPLKNPEYGAYLRQVLFGGGGFGGGRLGSILKELGQQGNLFTKDISDPTIAKQIETKIVTKDTPVETQKRKAIVVSDRLKGLSDKTVAKVKSKLATKALKGEKELGPITEAERKEFLEKQTYKSLKNLASEETQLMFGIKPKPGNLTKSDVKNAQIFINKDPDLFISLLPNQHTTKRVKTNKKDSQGNFIFETRPDKATGVQNVLLEAFYNKGTRKDNLTPWTKKSNIKVSDFLNVMGITERGNSNLYRKDSNVSARIKALVEQTGKIITNQTIRETLKDVPSQIADGKSPTLASKNLKQTTNKVIDYIDKSKIEDLNKTLKAINKIVNEGDLEQGEKDVLLNYFNEAGKITNLSINRIEKSEIRNLAKELKIKESEVRLKYMQEATERSMNQLRTKVGGDKKSLREIADKKNGKVLSSFYKNFIKKIIPKGKSFSDLSLEMQKAIVNTVGFGDTKTKDKSGNRITFNGRPFTHTEYKTKTYPEILEAAFGKEVLVGEGVDIKGVENVFQPGNWGVFKRKVAEISKDKKLSEKEKTTAVQNLLRGGLDVPVSKVLNANKEVLKRAYEVLVDEFIKNPTNQTMESILDVLAQQTNRSTGIFKGFVPMESFTLDPRPGEKGKEGGEVHNEHLVELFTVTKDIAISLNNYKNKVINKEQVKKELELTTDKLSQAVISKMLQERKDGTGASVRDFINPKVFFGKEGERQINIRENAPFETVAESIAAEGRFNMLKTLNYNELNSLGVKVKQREVNAKEFKEVKNQNIEVVKEASMASKDLTQSEMLNELNKRDKAFRLANNRNKTIKKARVFDFDDTVARTNSKVFAERDGKRKVLTAEEFAKQGKDLVDAGWKMDFSDFNRVVEGKKGPLFELMKKMKEAAGDRDMFILTARAPESAPAIKEFLDAMGIKIPLENITGLGNSTGQAKADWLVGKAAEGYNDFYFADDAPQNIKAVKEGMSRLDVKSKTQLVKASKDLKIESERDKKKLNWKTDEAGNIKTTFEVAGKKYNFNLDARDTKGSFDVEFNLGGRIDITGTGNAVKVIRTVYNGLLDVVSKNPKIKRLEFSSLKSEQSRVKLYTSLMDKVAKKLGWETDIWESKNFIAPEKSNYDFELTKPRKKQVAQVEKVLDVIDVKSETQKSLASKDLSRDFNNLIEESTGIGAEKVFSDVKAQVRGAKAKRQRFFIPPSAEDMLGLVYTTLGKGKKGEAHLKFYQENLFDPYTRAMENLSTDRVNLMADFKALKKQLDVPKDLAKKTESGFTNEQAVRVHLWNKMGEKIPGLSKTDLKELNDIVENNPKLEAFADQILSITKGDGYSKPKESWAVGTITTDLIDVLNTKKRGKYLETWKQNKDLIYSKENLNKLEAAYGPKYRAAIENSLRRMESGSNRLGGSNQLSNKVLDYINNSTGAIMFFNTRSAILQTLSAANFVNWSFNNPFKAGKAFANQPQYWKDFVELMNSDYLKDRRNGLKLNINESEIANAAKTSGNKAKAALNYILEKGYAPTKYADSFAIASGGATFYRNRINDLIKNEGKTEAEAKEIAMKEFRQVSEISQQSSDPSKISQQQASDLGRVVLQFANTPMQYARIQKRAVQDVINKRGDLKTNISKIAYYGFLQNMLFNGLQQGLFALGFGDYEIDEKEEGKLIKAANGMLDSSLRGLGMAGVTVQVLKNLGIDIYDRSKRDRPEYSDSYKKLLEFSPAIKSKLGKFQSAAYPFDSKTRRAEVFEKGFNLDNPAYESMAKVVTGTTNLPLDRMYSKVNNLSAAMDQETETWQSIAMVLGWPEWQIMPKEEKQNTFSRDSFKIKRNSIKKRTLKR